MLKGLRNLTLNRWIQDEFGLKFKENKCVSVSGIWVYYILPILLLCLYSLLISKKQNNKSVHNLKCLRSKYNLIATVYSSCYSKRHCNLFNHECESHVLSTIAWSYTDSVFIFNSREVFRVTHTEDYLYLTVEELIIHCEVFSILLSFISKNENVNCTVAEKSVIHI